MPEPTLASPNLPPDALAGEVAVVTGAGAGIGRALAIALAGCGAAVAIAEVAATGSDTEEAIRHAGGVALFRRTDVSREDDVAALARDVTERLGPATLLVNSAIVSPVSAVVDMDVTTWDAVMAVNLRGAFLTCRAFLPGMIAAGRGTIINMVSTDAMPFLSAYIAAKQGLVGLSQSLAAEVGPCGVRVIACVPGMVDTPGLRGTARDLGPRLGVTADQLLGMSMSAETAAAAVAYLAARLADEYHGEVVDGYTILERAGLRRIPGDHIPAHEAPAPRTPARTEAVQVAMTLGRRLAAMLAETDAEFARLPVFVRPMARRGLRRKSGLSTTDWTRTLADVQGHLEQVSSIGATAVAVLRAEHSRTEEALQGLLRYYREVPAEFSRFSRDQEALRAVTATSEERLAVVQGFLDTLHQVMA